VLTRTSKNPSNPALSAFERSIVGLKFAIAMMRIPDAFNVRSASTVADQWRLWTVRPPPNA